MKTENEDRDINVFDIKLTKPEYEKLFEGLIDHHVTFFGTNHKLAIKYLYSNYCKLFDSTAETHLTASKWAQ